MGKGVVRGIRDVRQYKGKVFFREISDVTDSARGKDFVRERIDVTM